MVCERCLELLKRIEELEKKLVKYENAHTPPSLRGGFRRELIPQEEYKKPGQKEGHIGTTRAMPKPTMGIELIEEKCSHCNNRLSKPFKIESKVIKEIPEPKPIEITEYKIGHYKCNKCGKVTIAKSKLPEGRFGNNVIAQSTLMKYDNRLPYRRVADTLERQYGLTITPASVLDLTRRASDRLRTNYKEIIKKIYAKVKAVTFKESYDNRKKLYDDLIIKLKQWVDYANCYKELRKFSVKISNGLEYFFTRILNPKIEATNNRAERALREHVVIRKIIGTLRNDKGIRIHETIMTMFATWKQQGLNLLTELKARLG